MSTSTKPTTETVRNKRPRSASRTGSKKKRRTSQNTFSTHWTLSAFFDRPPHRWRILAYLIYQPRETPPHQVLDGWRRSLEFIANPDNDQSEGRRSRASDLLARFRETAEESDSLDDCSPVSIGGENRNVILDGPRYMDASEPILTRIGGGISRGSRLIGSLIGGLIGPGQISTPIGPGQISIGPGQISGSLSVPIAGPVSGSVIGSINWGNRGIIDNRNRGTIEGTSGDEDDAEGTSGDEDDTEGTSGDEDDFIPTIGFI